MTKPETESKLIHISSVPWRDYENRRQ